MWKANYILLEKKNLCQLKYIIQDNIFQFSLEMTVCDEKKAYFSNNLRDQNRQIDAI